MDERVVGQLMLALYRAGRVGEALERFRAIRRLLVGELGTDPGRERRELHGRILAADPALTAPTADRGVVPRRLPAPPPRFKGGDEQALEHVEEALRLYRELGLPIWETYALNALGWLRAKLGSHDEARAHCRAALELALRNDYRNIQVDIVDSLGFIAHQTGRPAEALDHYRGALALCDELGETYSAANTLDRMGAAHAVPGRADDARSVWVRALDGYRAQRRFRDASRVEERPAALDSWRWPGWFSCRLRAPGTGRRGDHADR